MQCKTDFLQNPMSTEWYKVLKIQSHEYSLEWSRYRSSCNLQAPYLPPSPILIIFT